MSPLQAGILTAVLGALALAVLDLLSARQRIQRKHDRAKMIEAAKKWEERHGTSD